MGEFNLADYETVADRLKRFFDEKPIEDPRIITILHTPMDRVGAEACFEARIYKGAACDENLVSTGWAFEKGGVGFVNKTAWLENCETSAIGRALANIGMHGDKRPSREEMEKTKRMEREASSDSGADDEKKKYMKEVKGLFEQLGIKNTVADKAKKLSLLEEAGVGTDVFDDVKATKKLIAFLTKKIEAGTSD